MDASLLAEEIVHEASLFSVLLVLVPAVLACVLLHWAGIELLIRRLCVRSMRTAMLLLLGVLFLLVLHLLEITLFAGAMVVMYELNPQSFGRLEGANVEGFADVWYYAACVYTTVGFGDIVPVGPARFFSGVVALVGLLMITWSASFTFLLMQRSWDASFESRPADGR